MTNDNIAEIPRTWQPPVLGYRLQTVCPKCHTVTHVAVIIPLPHLFNKEAQGAELTIATRNCDHHTLPFG